MRVPQSVPELHAQLREQIGFLKLSAIAYDSGHHAEAKRMAATIRLLLHDTRKSRSLFGQLGMQSMLFLDGGLTPDPRNLVPTAGLTAMEVSRGYSGYVPRFTGNTRDQLVLRPFADWWTRPVIVDAQRSKFSRRDLVLEVADTDGGAHVDPTINPAYAQLSRGNSISWFLLGARGMTPMRGVELASVRQIGWELEESIKRYDRLARVSVLENGITENDACPCDGSLPYKLCHGSKL